MVEGLHGTLYSTHTDSGCGVSRPNSQIEVADSRVNLVERKLVQSVISNDESHMKNIEEGKFGWL